MSARCWLTDSKLACVWENHKIRNKKPKRGEYIHFFSLKPAPESWFFKVYLRLGHSLLCLIVEFINVRVYDLFVIKKSLGN